ncbi:hypothetical protein N0V83_004366 [Neocucurbitaria cava]|uniref:Laccase n=1 Tax=Neocucurbitaria cava TaxID=798079 RepID=A0A9W8Y8U0_9PLEO|nr:hypothetical protein N0V83_004366 [Neocucurbitaria cava]
MISLIVLWLSLVAGTLAGSCNFKLELTWGKGSPDGYERDMIFINGQYPGPLLEIQEDDWVEIEVINHLPFNTSIHYHGIHQTNTPWADGVPGLTQRPIQPGASFKYKWYADQYGSYFYHAHSRGQIDDGSYGPMYIKPKAGAENPFHLIDPAEVDLLKETEASVAPMILSDWRHKTSDATWQDQLASGIESAICMDSLLVNGKGAVDCWSREDINTFTNPAIVPLLQANGLQMTNKGCLPPKMFQILLGNSSTINPDALSPSVFEVCTPTQGSREVVKAPQDKKWLALDIISTAGIDTFAFSIDEHQLWVYAVDGHYIEPLKVDVLTVANGDRYSVFIELNKKSGNYGIRVASLSLAQLIDTTAVFSYGGDYGNGYPPYKNGTQGSVVTSTPYTTRAGAPTAGDVIVFDQAQMVSFPPQYPTTAPEIDQTFFMHTGTIGNSYTWALNSTPFNHPMIDDSNPPLLYQLPNANNPGGDITIVTKNNTWVDLIFLVPGGNTPPHPIHKHSNRGFIIGSGEGQFNWTSVAEAAQAIPQNFNFVSPPYRDGFVTPPSEVDPMWLAVRYEVVNPGAFMLHCHIQSHLNGGMAAVILDGVDEWPEVPDDCKN